MTRAVLEAPDYGAFRTALASSDCALCGLCRSRTQIVVDRGEPGSRVLVVGEAPGRNEDLEGKPFVGRSGRLLDRMLSELGFDTARDCLVSNVVKCRPPANRTPRPEEARACLPFLRKQIDLTKPRWVLLLGATALKRLFPEKKDVPMGELAGKFFTHPDIPGARIGVVFHPAYVLRDPRKQPLMRAHLKKFVESWRAG